MIYEQAPDLYIQTTTPQTEHNTPTTPHRPPPSEASKEPRQRPRRPQSAADDTVRRPRGKQATALRPPARTIGETASENGGKQANNEPTPAPPTLVEERGEEATRGDET